MVFLHAKFLQKAKSKRWLQDEHNRTFATWLRDRVSFVSITYWHTFDYHIYVLMKSYRIKHVGCTCS